MGTEDSWVERTLLDTVRSRKLSYYRHVMPKQGNSLEKEIMQGTIPGTRARGRPRMTWMDKMSRHGQDSHWRSQSGGQRTETNGESMSGVRPSLGSRKAN